MSQQEEVPDVQYMYRELKGVMTFSGFTTTPGRITWIGKNEDQCRPIRSQEDVDFFMKEMSQYD